MKLVMTLLVRDEEDIIRENIEFHLEKGVDFIIATDNLSVDSTKEILKEYERKGVLKYIFEPEDNYHQAKWVTRMARMAKADYNADWVINNDADEFWWPEKAISLKEVLKQVPSDVDGLIVQRYNFPARITRDQKFYESMIYRERRSYNTSGKPLPGKTCHRGIESIEVPQGNHTISVIDRGAVLIKTDLISIFHFPIRTELQIKNKIAKGGRAVEHSGLPKVISSTWRDLYDRYKKDGLTEFLEEAIVSEERIQAALHRGDLIIDTRLADEIRWCIAGKQSLVRVDKNDITIDEDDIILFGNIKDEALRLPYFIDYHRRIGVTKFVIVDNNSTDKSQEFLLNQPDIITCFTETRYDEANQGLDWINSLLDRYGHGKWTLTLDADELFVYPNVEQISLRELCSHLEKDGNTAFNTTMLDMYGKSSISSTHYSPGKDFLETCPYFDGKLNVNTSRDGARKRLFWDNTETNSESRPPVLKKTPLVKWQKGFRYLASTHVIKDVVTGKESGALLHFKLFSDFHEYAKKAVVEKNHWNDSAQYVIYLNGMRKNPDLTPYYEGSIRYENSKHLVSMGFIKTTRKFERYSQKILSKRDGRGSLKRLLARLTSS